MTKLTVKSIDEKINMRTVQVNFIFRFFVLDFKRKIKEQMFQHVKNILIIVNIKVE